MTAKCKYCGREFKNTLGRRIHQGYMHPDEEPQEADPEDAPWYGVTGEDHPTSGRTYADKSEEEMKEFSEKCLEGWKNKSEEEMEEFKKKISEALKKRQRNMSEKEKEELSKKRSKAQKKQWKEKSKKEKEEISKKLSEAQKRHWKNTSEKEREKFRRKCSEVWENKSDEEMKEFSRKISEGQKRRWGNMSEEERKDLMKKRGPTYPKPYSVKGLDHQIRSSWEEFVGLLLNELKIDYEYELYFRLPTNGGFNADFTTENNTVIEPHAFIYDSPKIFKLLEFHWSHPEYYFIIIGNIDNDNFPSQVCDKYLHWDNRSNLKGILSK